ncbi:flagellar protein FlbT [Litoreibacter ascidiaceicola]|uniref:Flagellar protein FlbT n=1 Tax=Litoreibacter ascidiaceicola TaxID=1486859 RepID=A0A1M5ASI5_9RHOB|nr:flagellar biosynthesis repressor FlbT [Litoreibacter ascidiaceicola]SHF33106.1 flagellar protein FlbT [Litoreibacter ascidiaceicola]
MSGLVIKLGPKERVLINGVVVENGSRRGRVQILTPNAKILRLKDAIHPDEVNTPVRRVCYILQLILSGDANLGDGKRQVLNGIEQLSHAFWDTDSRRILDVSTEYVVKEQFYPGLKSLRQLLAREARLMAAASE